MARQDGERLNRIAAIVAKVAEVFHWVAVGLLTASLAAYFYDETLLKYLMDVGDGEFAFWGYSVHVVGEGGKLVSGAFVPALIIGIIVCGMMAMIFRNIYLIFETTAGKTRFSRGKTPFQPDNVRMLREIGIFALSIPVIEWVLDGVVRFLVGSDFAESSVSFAGLVFGIALLCLSQFFAYGVQLQSDSDGLL